MANGPKVLALLGISVDLLSLHLNTCPLEVQFLKIRKSKAEVDASVPISVICAARWINKTAENTERLDLIQYASSNAPTIGRLVNLTNSGLEVGSHVPYRLVGLWIGSSFGVEYGGTYSFDIHYSILDTVYGLCKTHQLITAYSRDAWRSTYLLLPFVVVCSIY